MWDLVCSLTYQRSWQLASASDINQLYSSYTSLARRRQSRAYCDKRVCVYVCLPQLSVDLCCLTELRSIAQCELLLLVIAAWFWQNEMKWNVSKIICSSFGQLSGPVAGCPWLDRSYRLVRRLCERRIRRSSEAGWALGSKAMSPVTRPDDDQIYSKSVR